MELKASPYFMPIPVHSVYNRNIDRLDENDCSSRVLKKRNRILKDEKIFRGIPFNLGKEGDGNNVLLLRECPVIFDFLNPVQDKYIIFLHAADFKDSEKGTDLIYHPMMGNPRLGEVVCEYTLQYSDGTEYSIPVRRRFNINEFQLHYGELSFECVPHKKPISIRSNSEVFLRGQNSAYMWGRSQFRTVSAEYETDGMEPLMNHWLYAAENPYQDKMLQSILFTPKEGTAFIFGITTCNLDSNPLRWEARKKSRLILPLMLELNRFGDYDDIDIDLGQIISVSPILDYDNQNWEEGCEEKYPVVSYNAVIVEYTAHRNAHFYFGKEKDVAIGVFQIHCSEINACGFSCCLIPDAKRKVIFRVIDKKTRKLIAARIHVHGQYGEYLAPVNRQRIPNPFMFEDYGTDFVNGNHFSTYINGQAEFRLPAGKVYVEVFKGFEIRPVRKCFTIDDSTDSIEIELEHVLPWRQKGWVTADTHVHFLSPHTALLEGEGEGINVVNLLATQLGEAFTNMGDFDGKSTIGSKENGGTGEYLVRVGTENRQHVLGHISLLGYEGDMILPLCSGGSDESALGDAVEATLCDWARKCREQNGISIMAHHPIPRGEGAAALVLELIDAVETMGYLNYKDPYEGISPYSLSDWYRYLNCGYHVSIVGGTDKMSASQKVGAVRTYALIKDALFTYETWKGVIRKGVTFVTCGPLMDNGKRRMLYG